ncbi:MAG TPA: 16S rRNA (uracil(1498)-N(3))-methyltransferase [Opitutus sp.]|nr:16S rRNA (uracil(1498)-N(3))-methyltransferase [Opitutus sp.]
MPDFRVFCVPPSVDSAEIALSSEESHHLVSVNRARLGDPVIAFDGRGTEWSCELTGARKNAATLKVLSRRSAQPLGYAITLAQALPKGSAMDAIVRKATEIGAARIVPLESERTQVHLDGERSDKKIEKWQTAALEAAKQCGNPFLPEIAPVQSAARLMETAQGYDLKLIASLQPGAKSLKQALANFRAAQARSPRHVLWLVGPEGDFSPTEMNLSERSGFEPITLGPLVLRCETAAVYALSVLSYELQNG